MALSTKTDGAAWDALRGATDRMTELAHRPEVDLVALGKAFAALAQAMVGVAASSGQTSVRFSAASKALDLKTPKSALQSFVDG